MAARAPAAVLVGHSMGAYVVARLAAEHPERAAAVVLIDGGLPMPYPPDLDADAVLQAILGPAIQRLHRTFASVEEYVAFWRAQPARRTSTIQRSSLAAVAREAAMPARPPRRSWGARLRLGRPNCRMPRRGHRVVSVARSPR